jgi:hypothetical protein
LKAVLHSFKMERDPRRNGWLVEFYLGFYYHLEKGLFRNVEESNLSSKVLDAFNSTFISLIPKKNDSLSFEDYRDVSLCHLKYKIIVKVKVSILKRILSSFISQE